MAHITFIHGILNKPSPDELIRIWRDSLAINDGIDLAIHSYSMVYWADVLYPEPADDAGEEGLESAAPAEPPDVDGSWAEGIEGAEEAWTKSLAKKWMIEEEEPAKQSDALERIPLPWFIKKRLMRSLLRDVHHYLFNTEHSPRPGDTYRVQDEIRSRFIKAVKEGADKPGPHVVVSHSMGTVIAYDCLKRVGDCPQVDSLMTIGSPLGLDEVQDKLQPGWTRDDGFPAKSPEWVNVYDKLDVVAAFDPKLANDYRRSGNTAVDDLNEQNWGKWRHDIAKYLRGNELRQKLAGLIA